MSIKGQYRGNSAPGQLADSSGNGKTLILHGIVPNAASPTPPEGDRWLAYKPTGPLVNFLEVPTGVFTAAAGSLVLYFTKEFDDLVDNNMIFAVQGAGGSILFIFQSNMAGSPLAIQFYDGAVLQINAAIPNVASLTPRKFELDWDATGTRAYLDDVLQLSSAAPLTALGAGTPQIAGDSVSTSQAYQTGGIDFVTFTDSPPPPAGGAALLDCRMRR